MALAADKRDLFERLFIEFITSYPSSPAGAKHVAGYPRAQAEAKRGYDAILAAEKQGKDTTELVLRRMLPHADTQFNRERDAWVTFCPAVIKDIKTWYEQAPHIQAEAKGWPDVAAGLLEFVRTCVSEPSKCQRGCTKLAGAR